MATSHDFEVKLARLAEFAAPRYCATPFPAYRFIPGRFPHPTSDPCGHSYRAPGVPVPQVRLVAPQAWAASGDYLYGCDLYNHAYWWEAHEAWEGLWQLTDKNGVQGRFLKGLIQTSACHLKRFVGHANGVQRLSQTSIDYLRTVTAETDGLSYMGLDVLAFIASLEVYHHPSGARTAVLEDHDPRSYPRIQLDTGALGLSPARS